MIHPHKQFAIEHMGWQDGDKEPTEKQLVEAMEKHETAKATAKLAVLTKLKITADEAQLLLG